MGLESGYTNVTSNFAQKKSRTEYPGYPDYDQERVESVEITEDEKVGAHLF